MITDILAAGSQCKQDIKCYLIENPIGIVMERHIINNWILYFLYDIPERIQLVSLFQSMLGLSGPRTAQSI